MKKIKKSFSTLFCTLLILSLFACSVNKLKIFSTDTSQEMIAYETAAPHAGANGFSRASMKTMATADMAAPNISYEEAMEDGTSEKKLIKTVDINAETREFDKSIEWLKSYIDSYSGIIDSSYIDSGNMTNKNYRKNAYFNVRVPADKLNQFIGKLGDNLNVVFHQESVRDVTDAYDDTESRKKTLLLEEEKLNELLKKAKAVEELVTIESKLSEVRFELQNIENRLKRYDKQIDYSTININITEVKDLTENVEKEDYSKNNLLKLLNKNFEDTKKFVVKMGVYIFTHIPAICLGLILFVILLFIILFIRTIASNTSKKPASRKKTNKSVSDEISAANKDDTKEKTNIESNAVEDLDKEDKQVKKTTRKRKKK